MKTRIRNYNQDLRRAAIKGGQVVCSMTPYVGVPMAYAPRHKNDPQPWMVPGSPFRYSGRECHVIPQLPANVI